MFVNNPHNPARPTCPTGLTRLTCPIFPSPPLRMPLSYSSFYTR